MRTVLRINGLAVDMPWEDAMDAARMLVAMGRAIPGSRWIDSIAADEINERVEGLF